MGTVRGRRGRSSKRRILMTWSFCLSLNFCFASLFECVCVFVLLHMWRSEADMHTHTQIDKQSTLNQLCRKRKEERYICPIVTLPSSSAESHTHFHTNYLVRSHLSIHLSIKHISPCVCLSRSFVIEWCQGNHSLADERTKKDMYMSYVDFVWWK